MRKFIAVVLALFLTIFTIPSSLWACACGCGVFEVGTNSMFPTREEQILSFEYDLESQNRNWNGSSASAADHNDDKKLISNFFTVGYQHMVNRSWGMSVALPFAKRYFKVADETTGDIGEFTHTGLGDIRLKGIYTGFSDDMSTGLTFGVKLPTGSYKYANFDPDVQIGSGSTDLLIGAYHLGRLSGSIGTFTDAEGDFPVIHYSGYQPGSEINAAAGIYYDKLRVGLLKIAPLFKVVGTHRWSDAGGLALSQATGFSRVVVGPGIEFDAYRTRVYADVGFKVYQYTTGDQLIASQFYKLNVAYRF